MKKFGVVALICSVSFFIISGCSTVSEKRQANYDHENQNGLQAADISLRKRLEQDEARGRAMSDSKVGFSESDNSNHEPKSFEEFVINSMLATKSYDSQITLRITCPVKDSLILLYPRFKPVKWSFVDQSIQAKFKHGEVQTDGEGFARIRFTSSDSVYGKKIEISIGVMKRELEIGSGSPEIAINEEGCLNAR